MMLFLVVLFISAINRFNAAEVDYEGYLNHPELTNFRASRVAGSLSSCTQCGQIFVKDTQTVIEGSIVNPQNLYPFIVNLQYKGRGLICGGSLLNAYFVLTAAHCVVGENGRVKSPRNHQVAFVTSSGRLRRGPPIQQFIPHQGFSYNRWDHDIALIRLGRGVVCDESTNPICLPSPNHVPYDYETFLIIGWGAYMYGYPDADSPELREASIMKVPFTECLRYVYFSPYMKTRFYCGKGVDPRQTPCYGDSGGPMFRYESDNRFYIYGVASAHGDPGCNPNDNFIYTSVPKYLTWINNHMGGIGWRPVNIDLEEDAVREFLPGRNFMPESRFPQREYGTGYFWMNSQ